MPPKKTKTAQPRLPRNPVVLKAHRSGAGAHRSPLDYRRQDARREIGDRLGEISGPMYHLVPEPHFLRFGPGDPYVSETFYDEGFIHLTDPAGELAAVGNRYYRDDPRPYLVLEVDRDLVTAPLKYEDPAKIFPHLYGPLNRDAIISVRRFERLPDGTFTGPGDIYDGGLFEAE